MKEFKIEVKGYMLKKATDDFRFMAERNNDIPMPLRIMYGVKLDETKGLVKMRLHGDIKDTITDRCMCCGREITNPVSRYFGIGPVCGNHNYVNPFATEEELHQAVDAYRVKLVNTVWEGWIIKKAIESIDDDSDIYTKLAEMPCETSAQVTPEDDEEDISKRGLPYEIITEEEPKLPVIKVRIAEHNKVGDDYSAYLSFRYNPDLIDTIKNLPIRFWTPDTKEWEITCDELVDLQTSIKTHTFEIEGAENIRVETAELPAEFTFKTTPYKYQTEGIEYGLSHTRWLLCDQQGLGKTKQIIDLAVARKYKDGLKHCLIICGVNGLKWNWEEEIQKHSNESAKILGEYITRKGKKKIGTNKAKLEDIVNLNDTEAFFIITNVESLRNEAISDALAEACANDTIGMVAIDEFHMAKNSFSQQGKGILKLQPRYRIGMTGTPLMNTPLDFYQIFKWLGYQPYGYRSFRNHFCIFGEYNEVVGYKNLQDITKLLDAIMLRRTKDEVLDLPEKTYINEYVELTNEQEKVYGKAFELACAMLDKEDAEFNPLAEIIRLRQVTGGCGVFEGSFDKNPKLDRIEELVEEAINQGEKVVVFSQWTEMVKLIVARLEKYGIAVITGDTPDSDRQGIVNRFQTDDSIKVFIGSMKAVGVGLTLTAGSTVIFADDPWTDATKEQCIDRCHRIGTTKNVTVHTIMAHGTIDERVHDIIEHKAGLSAKLVDGAEVYEKREYFKYLLSA